MSKGGFMKDAVILCAITLVQVHVWAAFMK